MANGSQETNSRSRGNEFERRAERYLLEQGLRLLVRNYQCKLGEIDLVMSKGPDLVFVEVRYRKNSLFGGPPTVTCNQKG